MPKIAAQWPNTCRAMDKQVVKTRFPMIGLPGVGRTAKLIRIRSKQPAFRSQSSTRTMSTLTELAQQIAALYPLQDKSAGKRYRIVSQLAGMTELEAINGAPRYVDTLQLADQNLWDGGAMRSPEQLVSA